MKIKKLAYEFSDGMDSYIVNSDTKETIAMLDFEGNFWYRNKHNNIVECFENYETWREAIRNYYEVKVVELEYMFNLK